jgi:hypothetical protein
MGGRSLEKENRVEKEAKNGHYLRLPRLILAWGRGEMLI